MATEMSDKLSVREGLIEVLTADRFRTKPRSGGDAHVVVMEKTGGALRHYCTLRSAQDKLSIGEQLWGNYVCYVVDLGSRELRIEQEFSTRDRITNVRVAANITYHAVDGERVAIGVDDALQSLREELISLLKREIVRLSLEQVTEEHLEGRLYQASAPLQNWLGIQIERIRVGLDWDEEVLARLRAEQERIRAQKEEDAQRRREWRIQDEVRRRQQSLDLDDIDHIDQVIRRLGLDGLPADVRLRLQALPREAALKEVITLIEEQRTRAQQLMGRRMEQEYEMLRKLIDGGVLEEMDLVEFGKGLLERYQHVLPVEDTLGMDPSLVFGTSQRAKLGEGEPAQTDATEQLSDGPDESPEGSAEETPDTPDDEP